MVAQQNAACSPTVLHTKTFPAKNPTSYVARGGWFWGVTQLEEAVRRSCASVPDGSEVNGLRLRASLSLCPLGSLQAPRVGHVVLERRRPGSNHQLWSPRVPRRARPVSVCKVSSQDALCCCSVKGKIKMMISHCRLHLLWATRHEYKLLPAFKVCLLAFLSYHHLMLWCN